MKKILSLIGLAVLALNVHAQTPTYSSQTLWSTNGGVGAGIPSASAQPMTNAIVDCKKQKDVTFSIFSQSDTGPGNINTSVLQYSVDGINWSPTTGTNTFCKSIATPTSVAGILIVTNIPTFGCGYMRFAYTTNDTGSSITNIVYKYGVKISAP